MKIGIISLGLIGGSLFKCLTESEHEICAVTRNKETIEKAKQYAPNISNDYNVLKECNVIFVASPINKTVEILDKLEQIVNSNTIVLDCASVKEFIMDKKRPYKFIGSHPMAGTEFTGFDASFKELFKEAKWVLTPQENVDKADISTAEDIIKLTGAKTIITTPKEHDMAVALISHMPMLISHALFKTASNNELALKLASSGFRDMTRLAMSNPTMANDMLTFNAENIDCAIQMLNSSIKNLRNPQYFETCVDIKHQREKMYSQEGKNIL